MRLIILRLRGQGRYKSRVEWMAKEKKKKKKKAKSPLKAAEIRKFRKLLLLKRAEILGDVSSMKQGTLDRERTDLSNVPFHMADVGSDNYDLENTLGLMDEEVRLLAEIDRALTRMERGMYGICEGSGKPIPKARLEAIPWARYCVEYAQLLEKGLVRPTENLEEPEEELEEDAEQEVEESKKEEAEEDEPSEEDELDEALEQLDESIALMGDDEGDEEEQEEYEKR